MLKDILKPEKNFNPGIPQFFQKISSIQRTLIQVSFGSFKRNYLEAPQHHFLYVHDETVTRQLPPSPGQFPTTKFPQTNNRMSSPYESYPEDFSLWKFPTLTIPHFGQFPTMTSAPKTFRNCSGGNCPRWHSSDVVIVRVGNFRG